SPIYCAFGAAGAGPGSAPRAPVAFIICDMSMTFVPGGGGYVKIASSTFTFVLTFLYAWVIQTLASVPTISTLRGNPSFTPYFTRTSSSIDPTSIPGDFTFFSFSRASSDSLPCSAYTLPPSPSSLPLYSSLNILLYASAVLRGSDCIPPIPPTPPIPPGDIP